MKKVLKNGGYPRGKKIRLRTTLRGFKRGKEISGHSFKKGSFKFKRIIPFIVLGAVFGSLYRIGENFKKPPEYFENKNISFKPAGLLGDNKDSNANLFYGRTLNGRNVEIDLRNPEVLRHIGYLINRYDIDMINPTFQTDDGSLEELRRRINFFSKGLSKKKADEIYQEFNSLYQLVNERKNSSFVKFGKIISKTGEKFYEIVHSVLKSSLSSMEPRKKSGVSRLEKNLERSSQNDVSSGNFEGVFTNSFEDTYFHEKNLKIKIAGLKVSFTKREDKRNSYEYTSDIFGNKIKKVDLIPYLITVKEPDSGREIPTFAYLTLSLFEFFDVQTATNSLEKYLDKKPPTKNYDIVLSKDRFCGILSSTHDSDNFSIGKNYESLARIMALKIARDNKGKVLINLGLDKYSLENTKVWHYSYENFKKNGMTDALIRAILLNPNLNSSQVDESALIKGGLSKW